MANFLEVNLNEEEEIFISSVIVDLVSDEDTEKITNEVILHRVLEMATYKNRADELLRKLRKEVHKGKAMHEAKDRDNTITAYWDGFMACADMVKAILQESKKYNYQFMQKDESGKYMPDMAKLKANASCKEEVDYLTEVENKWEEYRTKGHEDLIGFNFNMCYVMKQACGHFEIFQIHAENEEEAVKWLELMEEESKTRRCTRCVLQ